MFEETINSLVDGALERARPAIDAEIDRGIERARAELTPTVLALGLAAGFAGAWALGALKGR